MCSCGRVLVWTQWFEVRPHRAGGLVVYGQGSPRACRCCGTKERSGWIVHSGNPSCVEGGDVEQVCSNLETYPCVCDCLLYLSLFLCLNFISCITYIVFTLHAWYTLVLILLYTCVGLLVNTSIQPREPTRHLNPFKGNLEELVQSLARGIRQHSWVIHKCLIKRSFNLVNLVLIPHYLFISDH